MRDPRTAALAEALLMLQTGPRMWTAAPRDLAAAILADPAFREALTAALADGMFAADPDDDGNVPYHLDERGVRDYWLRKAAAIVAHMNADHPTGPLLEGNPEAER